MNNMNDSKNQSICLSGFNLTHASARANKDELLQHFISVTKADCEMNLYLVRAKPGPQ